MILGFSDAQLSVVKRGPVEVREQGLLAHHIGEKVCPRVHRIIDDGYEMELLEPSSARCVTQLAEVFNRLRTEVWNRRTFHSPTSGLTDDGGWLDPLLRWSEKAPWLTGIIKLCYPSEPTDGYCLIHGDPALSNLMLRKAYFVVTDPMPRMKYREEIPNRVEVDLGKLLQSAAGWERILGCSVIDSMYDEWNVVLRAASSLHNRYVKLTLLWGAIHLARVSLRARERRQRMMICEWAEERSRFFAMLAAKA